MLRTAAIVVKAGSPLFAYFDAMAHKANNLYNAALFRLRQVFFAAHKDPASWSDNEKEIMREIEHALPEMNKRKKDPGDPYEVPDKEHPLMTYAFLASLLTVTDNPDYHAEGFPAQEAQGTVREACNAMRNWLKANRACAKTPQKFTGRPRMPGYKPSGGMKTLQFTNQSCRRKEERYLSFPMTKERLNLGPALPENAVVKQVTARPNYGYFQVSVVYELEDIYAQTTVEGIVPERILALDLGVNNIVAVANNINLPGLLFKGGKIKAKNQWFNKKKASITSAIEAGGNAKAKSKSLRRLSRNRNGFMNACMHTIANRIIEFALANDVDTIVIGVNERIKTGIHIGDANNQNFVSIPFCKLRAFLIYRAFEFGIRVVEQEESYTSKASFVDGDVIPVYKPGANASCSFSGKRVKRGQYRLRSGRWVNADLNGAGNILRKAFPDKVDIHSIEFLETVRVVNYW